MIYSAENNNEYCKSIAMEIESYIDYKKRTIYDYFRKNEYYDVIYRIDGRGDYKSVEVMIAGGGPNIYIDTHRQAVCLYWGGDEAQYYLSKTACNAIDGYFEEEYENIK